MSFNTIAPDNQGVHLHALIERTGCGVHKVPNGVPCYHLPNNVNPEAYYVGACGSRIRKGGFTGHVSAQSMRTEAPKKGAHGSKRPFKKNTTTRPAKPNGYRGQK